MRAVELNLATLEATVEQRLDAGAKTFAAQSKALEEVRRDIAPKRVSYLSLAGLLLSAVLAGGGLVWALSSMLSQRPTRTEMDQRFDSVKAQVQQEANTLKTGIDDQREQLQQFRTQVVRDLAEIKSSVRATRPPR